MFRYTQSLSSRRAVLGQAQKQRWQSSSSVTETAVEVDDQVQLPQLRSLTRTGTPLRMLILGAP
ncbi:hypothetical protein GGH18_002284, partial [Coemansia sp. RSA 530]